MVKTNMATTQATVMEGEIEARYKAKAEKSINAISFLKKPFFLATGSTNSISSGLFDVSVI